MGGLLHCKITTFVYFTNWTGDIYIPNTLYLLQNAGNKNKTRKQYMTDGKKKIFSFHCIPSRRSSFFSKRPLGLKITVTVESGVDRKWWTGGHRLNGRGKTRSNKGRNQVHFISGNMSRAPFWPSIVISGVFHITFRQIDSGIVWNVFYTKIVPYLWLLYFSRTYCGSYSLGWRLD